MQMTQHTMAPMHARVQAHSTPEPDDVPGRDPATPVPTPMPDDVPAPSHAPVQEPSMPEPPIRAWTRRGGLRRTD